MSLKPLVEVSKFFDLSLDVDDVALVRLDERVPGIFGHPARVDIHMKSGKIYSLNINDNTDAREVYTDVVNQINEARKKKLEITC